MDRAKWLEWRRGGIGSSDAAVLMGASPWKTRYDLYKEKVFGEHCEEDNDAMKYGRDMEPVVRAWLEDRYEMFLEPRNVEHDQNHWQRASLDAVSLCGRYVFEIKNPYRNEQDHIAVKAGRVPEKYYPQVMHQINVYAPKKMLFCSQFKGDYQVVEMVGDPEYINRMNAIQRDFWENHVLKKIPPELTDKDHREMGGNHEWPLLTQEWRKAKTNLLECEKDEEFYRKKLIELSLGKNASGCGVRLTASERKGNIDYEKAIGDYKMAIVADNPSIELPDLNLEDYRKSSTLTHRLSMY